MVCNTLAEQSNRIKHQSTQAAHSTLSSAFERLLFMQLPTEEKENIKNSLFKSIKEKEERSFNIVGTPSL
jgi:hypothetical protein